MSWKTEASVPFWYKIVGEDVSIEPTHSDELEVHGRLKELGLVHLVSIEPTHSDELEAQRVLGIRTNGRTNEFQ